jgi:hypothetical protein
MSAKEYTDEWDVNSVSGDWKSVDYSGQINGVTLSIFIDGQEAMDRLYPGSVTSNTANNSNRLPLQKTRCHAQI